MFDQFFDFYFSYLNSLFYAGLNLIGIYAGLQILRRTRNNGPLLILVGSVLKLLVGLSFPLSNFIELQVGINYDIMQQVWMSLSLLDLIGTGLLLIGIALVTRDFRSFLEQRSFDQSIAGQLR